MTVVVNGSRANPLEGDVNDEDEHVDTRVQRARLSLRQAAAAAGTATIVSPGDVIDPCLDEGVLRGHGTQVVDGQLLATMAGVVERVNKLVSVRPIKCRYGAECGDVVVGRINEIQGKRWKVDINSRQAAALLLSAVNLPGGIQRRRTNVDELNMRGVFEDQDLISAEVQQIMQDGMVSLHTRNLKYGKLEGGMLVEVSPVLIKRQKQHFHHLKDLGVDVIFGCNGWVWVGCHVEPPVEDGAHIAKQAQDNSESQTLRPAMGTVPCDLRARVCRVANVIKVLAKLFLPIHAAVVMELYASSFSMGVQLKDMMGDEFLALVLETEAEERSKM